MLSQGHTIIASFPRRVWGSVGALCLLAAAHADTPYLGNNAILTTATRATVAANGDSHAIATADPNAASAVLDWTKFNVGSGQTMTFNGAGTTFFNLVDGSAGKSQIDGLINGSGNVWVINPAGIAFSASAQVYLDGFFAAAAGNVSNADALRTGTAMLPEFSSFDGKVEVNGSPSFTSDKGAPVALLGKSISVNGGKFSWDCTFAAGSQIVVDNVNGGKVSLTVSDFIADPSVNTVDLGDLQEGGTVTCHSGGNTTLGNVHSTRGSINVFSQNGDIRVEPDAQIKVASNIQGIGLYSQKGGVRVGGNASLSSANNIQMFSAMGQTAKGDIAVNGKIDAASNLQLVAGYGESASGNVDVNGTLSGNATQVWVRDGTFTAGEGSEIKGTSKVAVYANVGDTGSISISGRVEGGDVLLSSAGEIALKNANDGKHATITATDANSGIGIYSEHGDVSVESAVTLTSQNNVQLFSAMHEGKQGDVLVDGTIRAENLLQLVAGYGRSSQGGIDVGGDLSGKDVYLISGVGEDSDIGNLSMNGNVTGKSSVWFVTGYGTGALGGDIDIKGTAKAESAIKLRTVSIGKISVGDGAKVEALGADGVVEIVSAVRPEVTGGIKIDGNVAANGRGGKVLAIAGYGDHSDARIDVSGNVSAQGKGGTVVAVSSYGIDSTGDLQLNGEVVGDEGVVLRSGGGDVGLGASALAKVNDGDVKVWADNGKISFSGGRVVASGDATLVAEKDVVQTGSHVEIGEGFAESAILPAAVSGRQVNFVVNGNLGNGIRAPFAVNGKVYGTVSGNASIAAAGGGDFKGGEGDKGFKPSLAEVTTAGKEFSTSVKKEMPVPGKNESTDEQQGNESNSLTISFEELSMKKAEKNFSALEDSSFLLVNGDLSVYTAGAIEANGILAAGNDMTVSARSFGDVSYLRAGGKLTINNVGHPRYPRVAYFESLDGKEPRINNLPNDMVIFVDGRLAGGNINIMNMFGANEAFLVSTPELKSTQGIFGDPPFLHSDLDVANPMEVSAIDYLIQEVPRLTLSSEFPADVDQKVEANGLSLKDSYWFGQRRVAARAEGAADGKVASGEEQ